MHEGGGQVLDKNVDQYDAADGASQLLYVYILDALDLHDQVDGDEVVDILRRVFLEEDAVGVAVVVHGHFQLLQLALVLPPVDGLIPRH